MRVAFRTSHRDVTDFHGLYAKAYVVHIDKNDIECFLRKPET